MTFADYATEIITIGNTVVVPLIFALAFAVFIFGILKYFVLQGGEEDSRTKGRQFAIWGILGFVLLFSVWGVINILLSTLGLAP